MVACENCNKFWFASLTLGSAAATIKESIAVPSIQHLLFPSQKKVLEQRIAAVDAGIECRFDTQVINWVLPAGKLPPGKHSLPDTDNFPPNMDLVEDVCFVGWFAL